VNGAKMASYLKQANMQIERVCKILQYELPTAWFTLRLNDYVGPVSVLDHSPQIDPLLIVFDLYSQIIWWESNKPTSSPISVGK
jgi:hypothetical protein